jgi:O-antigen ligase
MLTLPRLASALDFAKRSQPAIRHSADRQNMSARLLGWLSLCSFVAFLLPNHYSPWVSVHQEWAMALGFVPLCIWAVWRTQAGLPVLSITAWALAAVPALQLAAGQIVFSGDAWLASLYLAGFGLAVLAGDRYVARQRQGGLAALGDMWVAVVMTCIVSMGAAMHQWLDLQRLAIFVMDVPPGGRIFANLAQPNHFATLLLLGLTGLIFLFESRRIGALVALAAAFFFTTGLVMTGSRTVLLAILWFGLMYAALAKRCKLRLSVGAGFLVIAFYFLAMLAWPAINQALQLEVPTTVLDRTAPGVRTIYWQSMLDAISQAPGLGYGWGQIPFAQQAVALAHPPTHNFFESAHNLALDLVLWNGAPLGLGVVLLLAAWFFFQWRSVNEPLAWSLLLGLGCVFSHAAVELPLWYAYFLLPVGFWMGALGSANPGPLSRWRLGSPQTMRVCAALVGAAALAALVPVSMEYPAFEEDWRDMQFREKKLGTPAPYAPRHPLVLTQLEALLASSDTKPRPGMTAQELDSMRQVSRRHGFSSTLYRYALATGLNGDSARATETLRMLCSLHPPATCALARKDWAELGRTDWPQLGAIPFPESP